MRGNLSVTKSKFEPRAVEQCQLDATAKDRLLDDVRKYFLKVFFFIFGKTIPIVCKAKVA